MSLYKLFIVGFIGCAAFSLVAMDEKKAEYSKSVKWTILALEQTGIPKELQQMILQRYVDVSLDDKTLTEMKELLSSLNDQKRLEQYNGAKINMADLMWLDIEDKQKLVLVKRVIEDQDLYQDKINGSLNNMLCNENKEAISLPLWLRCKLGIKYSKSVKLPMQALKQIDIPQELRQRILELYIEKLNNNTLLKPYDMRDLEERNEYKFNIADLMWLDNHDKKKLVLAQEAIEYVDRPRIQNNINSIIDRTYNKVLTEQEYENVTSSPLYLRRKVAGLGAPRNVGVLAGQYDFKPEEKELLFNHFMLGGTVGFCLYGATVKGLGDGELSLSGALASYLTGAGCAGIGSWLNTMKQKRITPSKPWVKEKPLCPEMVTPLHKSYWQPQSRMIQLKNRE